MTIYNVQFHFKKLGRTNGRAFEREYVVIGAENETEARSLCPTTGLSEYVLMSIEVRAATAGDYVRGKIIIK